MAQRLTDNLTSLYLAAGNKMQPKKARKRIVAYVESYDDVSFWRSVLRDFEDDTHYFEVMLPSRRTLTKGKKQVLMNKLGPGLGGSMIACVDSDYDYLMQGSTPTSAYMLNNPFVFHTYVYAIENYQCVAESLHEACVMSTLNDRKTVDFVPYLTVYSQLVYPLLVWSVWFYRQNNLNEFSMTDFCAITRIEHFCLSAPMQSLEQIQRRCLRKLRELEHAHPEVLQHVEMLKSELHSLGVTPDNAYLYIQGHHLMENVVMRMLQPICIQLRKEREQEIQCLACHKKQLQNELANYDHRLLAIDVVLRKHTAFKQSAPYQRLKSDLTHFLKKR